MVNFALEIARAARPLKVFVSDCDPYVPTMHMSTDVTNVLLPRVLDDEERYFEELLARSIEFGIDLIIPLSDLELGILARQRAAFLAKGISVAVSDDWVVETCADKKLTYEFFRQHGLPMPESFFALEHFSRKFPCIRKPLKGSASRGLSVVKDAQGLAGFEPSHEMLQALVPGAEYGVDILNDLDGNFVSACVKRKILMRAGETDRAEIIHSDEIGALARRISEKLRHRGVLDLDVKQDATGDFYCIDLNPRFGGGYPMTHVAGLNYLQALIDMFAGTFTGLKGSARKIVVLKGISLHWFDA
jgi:carbamoyl-phosphate synthase large subunit